MLEVKGTHERIRFDRLLIAALRCYKLGMWAWGVRLSQRWDMIPRQFKCDGSPQSALDVVVGKQTKKFTDEVVPCIPTINEEDVASHQNFAARFKSCDPIDGTSEFENASSVFCTSATAWVHHGQLEASIIVQPAYYRSIATLKGAGTQVYDGTTQSWRPLVRDEATRPLPIGIVGSRKEAARKRNRDRERSLKQVYRNCPTDVPTVYGGTQVGLGDWGVCFTYGTGRIWDYAPPALLTEEQGGIVRHLSGRQLSWDTVHMGADEDPIIFARSQLHFDDARWVIGNA